MAFFSTPAIHKYADASKNIKVRIKFVNGKTVIETITNANNPGGCDKARTMIEESLELKDAVESATSKHPVEEKITTPSPAQIEEVEQIKSSDQKK